MDVSITLKGRHEGEPIEVLARGCTVHEERQTWDYPGSLDIDYEDVVLNDDQADDTPLDDILRDRYEGIICDAIYEAWHDQEPF